MKRFRSHDEILELVRIFEDATISREAWKHPEHLTVALYYVGTYDLETATEKMRAGIMNLLTRGFGVDLEEEMPYHETMTRFWMNTVAEYAGSTDSSSLLESANELVEKYDREYPLRYYSRELLFSDEARRTFVAADLEQRIAQY